MPWNVRSYSSYTGSVAASATSPIAAMKGYAIQGNAICERIHGTEGRKKKRWRERKEEREIGRGERKKRESKKGVDRRKKTNIRGKNNRKLDVNAFRGFFVVVCLAPIFATFPTWCFCSWHTLIPRKFHRHHRSVVDCIAKQPRMSAIHCHNRFAGLNESPIAYWRVKTCQSNTNPCKKPVVAPKNIHKVKPFVCVYVVMFS